MVLSPCGRGSPRGKRKVPGVNLQSKKEGWGSNSREKNGEEKKVKVGKAAVPSDVSEGGLGKKRGADFAEMLKSRKNNRKNRLEQGKREPRLEEKTITQIGV